MTRVCNTKCKYFPKSPSVVNEEYKDENGVKHRKAEYYCEFDDHIIKEWCTCKNYK